MKIAYFDCFSGISGDMTLGAFLDAGLSLNTLSRELKKLKISGYELKSSKVMRGALSGTKFDCISKEKGLNHRSLKDIIALIDKSGLDKRVKDVAKKIFLAIGDAEAKAHGVNSKADIHLHELGDIDSIIDIVGAAIAVNELGIDEVHSSNITLGRTFANTKGGVLPIPSPASLELLKGIPTKIVDIERELVTPTGAGILKVLSRNFGEMPQLEISDIGYGAGSKDFGEVPNMLRVIIGERVESFLEDRIFVVETNIDDMNPQNFEYLFEKLLKEGALDVYTTNIQMKKSRPAFKLTVLVNPRDLQSITSAIFSETTTIGLRFYETNRLKLERKIIKVNTKYGNIKVKLSKGPHNIMTVSPEYDECARLAKRKNIPLKVIYEEAKQAGCRV